MQSITIPQKDYGYNLAFTVTNATSVATNLQGYNVKLKTWSPADPGTLLVSSNCVVVSNSGGTCNYNIASGDFNTVGIYYAELELTTGNTVVESTDKFKLIVAESG